MIEYIVTDKAQRPVDPNSGTCFYCNQYIGEPHLDECVLIQKKVRVRATIEYDIEVPNYWQAEELEFHRNEGSWCSDNMIRELEDLPGCLCHHVEFEYLKDTSGPYIDED